MYRKCEKGLVHCLLPILARDGLGRSKEAIIFFFFLVLFESQKKRETQRERDPPHYWLTPQMVPMAGPDHSQELRAPSWSPTWVTVAQILGLIFIILPGVLAESWF